MYTLQVILGSTRPTRAADPVARWVLDRAGRHPAFRPELLDLRDWPLPMFGEHFGTIGDLTDPTYSDPIVRSWNAKIREGDAYLVITPEYNHSVPGVLKNAIDSVFVSFAFRNKPMGIVAYSGSNTGGVRAAEHLAQIAVETEAVPLRSSMGISFVDKAFDAEGFYRTGDAMKFGDPSDPAQGLLFDGRIAENFKLSNGTWVDAGGVRVAVLSAAGSMVDDCVVCGENRDAIGVVLILGARARAVHEQPVVLRDALASLLRAHNAQARGSTSRIGRAILTFDALSPVEGEITDKGSVNQRRVLERRPALVQRLFADAGDPDVIVFTDPSERQHAT